jgi:hypothetical protein
MSVGMAKLLWIIGGGRAMGALDEHVLYEVHVEQQCLAGLQMRESPGLGLGA